MRLPCFVGVPTVLWTPQLLTSNSCFGVQTNQFGFDVTWADGMRILEEAYSNLENHVYLRWRPTPLLAARVISSIPKT
jgi:hypothetical protein